MKHLILFSALFMSACSMPASWYDSPFSHRAATLAGPTRIHDSGYDIMTSSVKGDNDKQDTAHFTYYIANGPKATTPKGLLPEDVNPAYQQKRTATCILRGPKGDLEAGLRIEITNIGQGANVDTQTVDAQEGGTLTCKVNPIGLD